MPIQPKYIKKMENPSLSQFVVDQIGEALLRRDLKPGDRLPTEIEMTEMFGVGKSSVREAVKMLQAMGIAETRHGEGTFISAEIRGTISNSLVYRLILGQGNDKDMYELRKIFEPAFTVLAMEKATEEDIERIKEANKKFGRLVADGVQTIDDDMNFHRAILAATNNPYVIQIGETVMTMFKSTVEKSNPEIPERAVREHERIINAFVKRDPDELYQAVVDSMGSWSYMLGRDKKD